jgi:uncharacterized membrane protein
MNDLEAVVDVKDFRTRTFTRRDLAEIAIGCSLMAFPVATTEEIWKLGETLSTGRLLLVAAGSIAVLTMLMHELQGGTIDAEQRRAFMRRVLSTYGVTIAVSALMLLAVDRLELLSQPLIGLRRTILVAFPASFAGTVVDNLR